MANSSVVLTTKNYLAEAKIRSHFLATDVPVSEGGADTAPTPVEYLLTAIGGCVAVTLRMYAARRNWDVGEITVNVFQLKERMVCIYRKKYPLKKKLQKIKENACLFLQRNVRLPKW